MIAAIYLREVAESYRMRYQKGLEERNVDGDNELGPLSGRHG